MNASEHFKGGRLDDAIEAQLADVKAHPADAARRLFLFELLLFKGDLERAGRQGGMVKFNEIEVDATLAGYLKLLDSEMARRKVLRDGGKPMTYGPHESTFTTRLAALDHLRYDRKAEATQCVADEELPVLSGTFNGKPFASFADGDDLLAPFLEVHSAEGYYWVPLAAVRKVTAKPPQFPRDLMWLPALLELDHAEGEVFLPALYAFSHESANDQIKLGKDTEWVGADGELVRGMGQKTFLMDEAAVGLLDLRELVINPPAA